MFGHSVRMAACGLLVLLATGNVSPILVDDPVDSSFGAIMPAVFKPPKPEFTRVMYAAATIKTVDKQIDKCRGPIAVNLGSSRPVLVAEHDYCGGSAWISKLESGAAVRLSGPGVDDGLYVTAELKTVPRDGNATVRDLPQTDVVLQTCISRTEMVLVGLTKFYTEESR